jgi:hypothetical protein
MARHAAIHTSSKFNMNGWDTQRRIQCSNANITNSDKHIIPIPYLFRYYLTEE